MNKSTLEFRWSVSRGRDSYGYPLLTLIADGRRVARTCGGGYDMKGTNLGNYLASAFADRLVKLTAADMPSQSHWENERARHCAGECLRKWREEHMAATVADKPGPADLPKLGEDVFECPVCGGPTRQSHDGKRIDDGRYFYGLSFVDPNYDFMAGKLERADGTFTTEADVGKTFRELKEAGKIVDLDIIRSEYKQRSHVPTERHTYPVIDGACGFSSVEQIAKAIGLTFEFVPTRGKNSVYLMHDNQPQLAST